MFKKLFASLLLVLALTSPVIAQEEPTAEPTPPVVVDEAPVADDTVSLPSWALTNSYLILFAAGAITVIITSAINNRNLKQALENTNKAHRDAIEAAYEVVPEHIQEGFQHILGIAENLTMNFMSVLEFVKGVTDGKENQETPTLPPDAAG